MDIENLKTKRTIKELLEFGIINIDKSSGPTSFNVSSFVKKTLNLRKTSHFGTLDPKVTGVLPVSLNRACKLMGYFLGEDKEYIGIMRIHKDCSMEKIKAKIKEKFLGKIKQTPPLKSRVKRQEREREIKKFELLEKNNKDILFHVVCEGGTYIRKLLDDLGKELEIGAHMLELRRMRAGIFDEKNLVSLYDFEKYVKEYLEGNEENLRKIITPAEIITKLHPTIKIKEKNKEQILTGKPIHHEDLIEKENFKKGETIIVFCENQFIGIYEVLDSPYAFAKPNFVMQNLHHQK